MREILLAIALCGGFIAVSLGGLLLADWIDYRFPTHRER